MQYDHINRNKTHIVKVETWKIYIKNILSIFDFSNSWWFQSLHVFYIFQFSTICIYYFYNQIYCVIKITFEVTFLYWVFWLIITACIEGLSYCCLFHYKGKWWDIHINMVTLIKREDLQTLKKKRENSIAQ